MNEATSFDVGTMRDILVEEALQICRVPSPTFAEERRARYVAQRLEAEGAEQVEIDKLNNVTALLRGSGNGPALMVVAHIDTVFPEGTDVEPKWDGQYWRAPGIRDNSASVAVTLMLPRILKRYGQKLAGDLILAFSVGEEGLGNLRGIRALMERFKDRVSAVIVADGNLGVVNHIGISVRRLEIEVKTEGGHSWADAGKPSALHALAKIAGKISDIAVPKDPKSVVNIGTMAGGTSVNSIAQLAKMSLDIRSVEHSTVVALESQVREIIRAVARDDLDVSVRVIGDRPGGRISPEHPLVAAIKVGYDRAGVKAVLVPGSTDANIPLSLGIPAASMGVSAGGGIHTLREFLDPESLPIGAEALMTTLATLQKGWD
jgi:acetylornithine deacetylase/succinyl-diaminopimelate desuccinylase-like protein